jgi:ribosomal protein S18 acetylase RimI-like enzyme
MTEQRADGRPDVAVRPLVAGDWAQLRAARLAALAEAPYAFASTFAREEAFDEDLWRSRAGAGRTFGAFDGSTVVGLATGFPLDDRPKDWHLVGMWVAPASRGQGVADRLVEAVCEQAKQAGAGAVTLWVTEVNDRARAFYRRLRFAPTGARQLVWPQEPDHWEEELARRLT